MIDYDRLDKVEEICRQKRKEFPNLSTRYVAGEGDNPRAFIIGEAPGATEDMALRPFVGTSGRILRDLMALAGLHCGRAHVFSEGPANCWLTNAIKFRPPGNRTPNAMEIAAFRLSLAQEWHAVGAPRLIIPVGSVAFRALTGKQISILRAAGHPARVTSRQGKRMMVWPMLHPAFVARAGDKVKELAEADWERIGEWRKEHDTD